MCLHVCAHACNTGRGSSNQTLTTAPISLFRTRAQHCLLRAHRYSSLRSDYRFIAFTGLGSRINYTNCSFQSIFIFFFSILTPTSENPYSELWMRHWIANYFHFSIFFSNTKFPVLTLHCQMQIRVRDFDFDVRMSNFNQSSYLVTDATLNPNTSSTRNSCIAHFEWPWYSSVRASIQNTPLLALFMWSIEFRIVVLSSTSFHHP